MSSVLPYLSLLNKNSHQGSQAVRGHKKGKTERTENPKWNKNLADLNRIYLWNDKPNNFLGELDGAEQHIFKMLARSRQVPGGRSTFSTPIAGRFIGTTANSTEDNQKFKQTNKTPYCI